MRHQMSDVAFISGEKVVRAKHIMPLSDQPLTEMGAQKACATSDKNSVHLTSTSVPNCKNIAIYS